MAAAGNLVGIYNCLINDVTSYMKTPPGLAAPGNQIPPVVSTQFMNSSVIDIFTYRSGKDITKMPDSLNVDLDTLARQKVCLRNLYTVGKVDNRNSPQCQSATHILLALSIVMVSVIESKFLALHQLRVGFPRAPEEHDKFVIFQVPLLHGRRERFEDD
jgi:chitin synthase